MLIFYLLVVFPAVALLSLLCYLPVWRLRRRRLGRRPFLRHLTIYALIGAVLSLLYATIFIGGFALNVSPGYHLLNLTPFAWVRNPYEMGAARMIEQLVMNVLMLVPLGFLLPAVWPGLRGWWKTGLCVLVLVVGIETLQYFIGRSCDVDDVIMNTAGGLIGWGLFAGLNRLLKRRTWWKNVIGEA